MHRAAYHFINALGIPSLTKTKRKLSQNAGDSEDDELEDEEADVDTSMDVEASAEDAEAVASTIIVDYQPGDCIGKLLAFVNQV